VVPRDIHSASSAAFISRSRFLTLSRPQRAAETAPPAFEPAKMPANCGLFARDREPPVRIGLRGGGCSPHRTGLSLQFGQMQGDFRKMQGGGRQNLAKSHQISIAWNGVSLLKRAGKSRENHLCPAAWRSRLRPELGIVRSNPVLASNLQHLHFSECQLESWERTRWDSELGTLTRSKAAWS
jgi:hypothetical protein